jgi:hypothetical protein
MAGGNQSTEILSYVGVESDDELKATNSDVETSESLEWNVKEYWLGKKYFKFALAQLFVEASDDDESLPELDVRNSLPFLRNKLTTSSQNWKPRAGSIHMGII